MEIPRFGGPTVNGRGFASVTDFFPFRGAPVDAIALMSAIALSPRYRDLRPGVHRAQENLVGAGQEVLDVRALLGVGDAQPEGQVGVRLPLQGRSGPPVPGLDPRSADIDAVQRA